MPTTDYYAHSFPGESTPTHRWQLLRDHLANVSHLAGCLAEAAQISGVRPELARAAGWLHDIGKYRHSFQEYIRGRPPLGSKGHKQAGAAWAAKAGDIRLAFAILGHHHGMPDKDDAVKEIKSENDGLPVIPEIESIARTECPALEQLKLERYGNATAETDLSIRLLLSCLVDADWSDTSEHERIARGWPTLPAVPLLDPTTRLLNVQNYITERAKLTQGKNPPLATIRDQILNACLVAAEQSPGLFTLTVPTGGGKTLSALAFALKHAATHNLRRVIYVAPYISILDQNANVIRQALNVPSNDLTVFEHHSLAEPQGAKVADEKQSSAAARRAENWDSPVVLTTNVQLFESLFSNKPGRCRKLHNIAKSVIILDECQTLPPDLVKPTCQMLKQLTDELGCTVVLCTATQPAFDHETLENHRLTAKEIIPKERDLFAALKRVAVQWPTTREERLSWRTVAERMKAVGQSTLCVVNTKQAALDLFAELKANLSQNIFHLSTSMCPAHRLSVLGEVKRRLDAKEKVYLVSTQLIEAGVDIDFPCVFREMAPLESIIQAAGRCNREGLIPNAGGRVVVFRSEEGETRIPSGWYKKGRDVLETEFLAAGVKPSVENPADILNYFSRLYWKGDLDPKNIVGMRTGFQFATVAEEYKLIREDTVPVAVATWDEYREEIEKLLDNLRAKPNRSNFRALAPFQVNVFRSELSRLPSGMVLPLREDIDFYVWHGIYDPQLGRTSEFQNLIDAI